MSNAHSLASAVNRLLLAQGVVPQKASQKSYWRLRHIVTEGGLSTVEELWNTVQARMARRDASLQAAKDARKAIEAAEQERSEMAQEQYERDNA
jgi:F0F1-type ATP synthase epsilon subunit